jgi:hypothetical protein
MKSKNITEKIKCLIPILKIIWRKKSYWSITVPIGLFLLGEIAKSTELPIIVTNYLLGETENVWIKHILMGLKVYFEFKPFWVSLVLVAFLLTFFTFVYLKELKYKNIDTKVIIDEIKNELTWQPDDDWFVNQCNKSIQDLGKRYTTELNFELEDAKIFDGLGRTTYFENDVKIRFDKLLIKGRKIIDDKHKLKNELKVNLDKIYALFIQTDFSGTSPLPIEKINTLLTEIQKNADTIYDYYFHDFQNFIRGIIFKLANNPFLLIDGEAGIGKSHLLGDVITKRMQNNYESIFLLGQHFVTDENPWTQIFDRLQIKSTTSSEFLETLNQRAEKSGKRIIIFIDAINEGRGKYFWKNNINSFVNEIKLYKYKWLGLVLSIRTTYKEFILPNEQIKSLNIETKTLYGFKNVEYEASKLFFENYDITLPNVPLLHPEFQNPLFLKLFCEGISRSGNKKIPDGLQGISSIIDFFINNVNSTLSSTNRVEYSEGVNLVKKSIDILDIISN